MHKKHDLTSKKQIIEILVVAIIFGIGLLIYDYQATKINFDGTFERNDAGHGNIQDTVQVQFDDEVRDMDISVSEKLLTEEAVNEAFDAAIEEIDNTFLGENKSANDVRYNLNLKEKYYDGLINAQWQISDFSIISTEGIVNQDNVPEEGSVISLNTILSYEDYKHSYGFSVVVNPIGMDTSEGKLININKAIKAVDENTRDSEKLVLPKEVENLPLKWTKKMDFRGLQMILLGVATCAALVIGKKQDEKKAKLTLINEKERDYPMIVSELSILMGAGMSFRKALERIVARYQQKVKKDESAKSAGYEDILRTHRKMQEGTGELAAIEELGRDSGCKEYRKLATLLSQNLRKGSRDLIDCLEKEELYAFELKKQRAIRAGEEASTKLLIPMGGMLFIIIVILIVPAMLQMKG
ncbi:MAG: type II secretion system F family protein [Pseudobutyrivibrio sp.]|nr:type II secretion system F family protein [Pseudobutyrivibrio sp.]